MNALFMTFLFVFLTSIYSFAQYELPVYGLKNDTSLIKVRIKAASVIQDADSAVNTFTLLLASTEQYKMVEETAEILALLGEAYFKKDERDIAKSYLHRGMHLARVNGVNGKALHRLYTNLALVCQDRGESDSAIFYNLESITIAQSQNLKNEVAVSYYNLSLIFSELKDFKQSIHYLEQSLQISQQTDDYKLISKGYLQMGTIYLDMSDTVAQTLNIGFEWLLKGLSIVEAHKDQVLSKYFFNAIGLFYQKKLQFQEAIGYFEKALQVDGGRASDQIALLGNLSATYCHVGNYSKGEEMALKALDKARKANRTKFYATIHCILAFSYRHQGKYKEASEHYEESIRWLQKSYNESTSSKVQNLRFQYETAQKDRDLISRQLEITQQKAQMDQNRIMAIAIVLISLLMALAVWLYFQYRHRIHKQQEQQALEIAAWRASMEGEEKERRRLAKNLHDNIGGHLSTLKMWLGTIQDSMNGQLTGVEEEYGRALDLLDHTLTEVRNTAHHLMPELLLRLGLAEGIRIYCSNIKMATRIDVQYQYLGYIGDLDHNMELLIYRIVQELVQNVVKHARAGYLLVQLGQFDQTLTITVEDNGKGMDVATLVTGDGMGLSSIRNSIEKIKGKFRIHSEPGGGTTIEMELNTAEKFLD